MSLLALGQAIATRMEPEAAHRMTIKALKTGVIRGNGPPSSPRLEVHLKKAGLTLPSPVGLAAGFDKNADVPNAMASFGFGFVECGTVTPKAQPGNEQPRLFRLREDKAVINRMGFNNEGLERFIPNLKRYRGRVPVGANVGANKTSTDRIADYEGGIFAVYPYTDYITINISSPNTPGLRGLQDKGELSALLTRCQGVWEDSAKAYEGAPRPTFLKLAPDLDDEAISDIVGVVEDAGKWLSGLIISNTTLARPDSLQSESKGETGGLSGAPLFEPSTEILRRFAKRLEGGFDLIGAGGIASGEQAYAKICAGASAVQLYSALVYEGIGLVERINQELITCLEADGFASLQQAVGSRL